MKVSSIVIVVESASVHGSKCSEEIGSELDLPFVSVCDVITEGAIFEINV